MKKIISFALICILLLGALNLAACSKKDDGKLTIALNAEFEPFESLKDGEYVGYDIDIINEIGKKLGMEVVISNMEFEGVVAAVQSGSYMAAISGITITPKRVQSVDFSIPYYSGAAQMLIVRNDDTVFTGTDKATLDEQLKDKNIGVCAGFTGESYVNGDDEAGIVGIEGAASIVFDNISLAVSALKNGTIDVIIMDDSTAKKAAGADENKDAVRVIDVALSIEEYGIAVKKGDDDLLGKINKALEEMKSEGTIDKLAEKWELNAE